MTKPRLILATVLAAGVAASANAQPETLIHANLAFAFKAGENSLPAGHYEIKTRMDSATGQGHVISIKNVETGKTVLVEYLTTIAPRHDKRDTLVFDRVGQDRMLSEIHLADSDGFLLAGAGHQSHSHELVEAARESAAKDKRD